MNGGQTSATLPALPSQPTTFIGRDRELGDLALLLADPGCRLLTLTGPGGIGKTRLAIEATRNMESSAGDLFYVSLQPVASSEFLVSAIADGVRCSLSGLEDPQPQLLRFFAGKRALLLLDNLEHLLDGIGLLSEILAAAGEVKIVATSRQLLNLREEWHYPVHGLPFPQGSYRGHYDLFSAVRLFVERATRVRPGFSLASEEDAVGRITQLVEGMPLAIELAASWVNTLSCAAIADEIQAHIDFLATELRNVPARHRSMRAAFEQSWRLLDDEERRVFKRLSVFRGGFERDAAREVASATLQVLSSLVAKSLLWREASGRYQLHELLRQFAEERLDESPEDSLAACDSHCGYYSRFMEQRTMAALGREQSVALSEIGREMENVRAAWRWAIEHSKVVRIGQAARAMFFFCQFKSRYREGADAFERAAQSLDAEPRSPEETAVLASVLVADGWMQIRLGGLGQAAAVLNRSRDLYDRLGIIPLPGIGTDPLVPMGILANVQGDYAEAMRLGKEALARSQASGDKWNVEISWYVMAGAAIALGEYENAAHYASQSAMVNRETGNNWFRAYSLNQQGEIARALGDYKQSGHYYRASYGIRKELEDPEGMALALAQLGEIALLEQDLDESERLYHESIAMYGEIGDQGGLSIALAGLGRVASARRDYSAAHEWLISAVRMAAKANIVPYVLIVLTSIGELLINIGDCERAVELLALASAHKATNEEAKKRAEGLIARCKGRLAPALLDGARKRGTGADLDAIVAALPDEIARRLSAVPDGSRTATREQPLAEPLTEREIEVLRCMADGLSNREIAERLVIAVGTVKWYISQITGKLGAHNRTHAVAEARRLNLLG